MDRASNEGGWTCENTRCGTVNSDNVYQCQKCKARKPYFVSRPGPSSSADVGATSLLYDVSSITTTYGSSRHRPRGLEGGAQAAPHGEPGCGSPQDEEVIPFPGDECRMVLMGKTGNGKSSTGNTIVGTERFAVGRGMGSRTKKCQWHNCTRFGINIEVVDTPGFFDTKVDDVTVRKEVMRCVGMVSPGPHALLLVVRLDARFTKEEADSVNEVRNLFGDEIMRHVIIVFTHGDTLDGKETEAIRERTADAPASFHRIMQDVDGRYVVFNNKGSPAAKRDAVRRLLLTIRGMISTNNDQAFSSPFLQQCEEAVMTKATQLGDLLDSKILPNKNLRDLLRGGLEGRERLEEILHDALDQQQQTEMENELLRQSVKELQDKLDEHLRAKKPWWKCTIL